MILKPIPVVFEQQYRADKDGHTACEVKASGNAEALGNKNADGMK